MSAKKILLILFGLIACGLLVLGVSIALILPRLVEQRVVAEARARGVELTPGEVSFGLGWLQVTDSRLTLIGVPGLEVRAGLIDAELDGLSPVRFTMARVQAVAVGEPLAFARQLDAWARARAGKLEEPLHVKPLTFTLRSEANAPSLLALEAGELRFMNDRAELVAERALAYNRDLGGLRIVQDERALWAGLTLKQSALDNPIVALELGGSSQRNLHVAVSPVTLGHLEKLLGFELPLDEGVTVSGTLGATIPNNMAAGGRVTGRVDVILKGYVPPHPVELDGFVFGDTTQIGSAYRVEPENLRVVLEQSSVKAGRFELLGGGEVQATGLDARLTLLLTGDLPCNALAGAAAETRLGRALGRVTGKAARQVVSGRVGVRVSVEARASALDRARVLRTILPGCGLKALSFSELLQLGELIPEAMDPKVQADFEKLLEKNLPPLPPPGGSVTLRLPDIGDLKLPALPGAPRPNSSAKSKVEPGNLAAPNSAKPGQ